VHRIHESADARRFGVASIFDFRPDVGARLAKKLVSHHQISQAAYCSAIALMRICKLFGVAVFDPIQF
jgi:hypothetical protein